MCFTIAKLINGSIARGAPLTTLSAPGRITKARLAVLGCGALEHECHGGLQGVPGMGSRSRDIQGHPSLTAHRQLLKVTQPA